MHPLISPMIRKKRQLPFASQLFFSCLIGVHFSNETACCIDKSASYCLIALGLAIVAIIVGVNFYLMIATRTVSPFKLHQCKNAAALQNACTQSMHCFCCESCSCTVVAKIACCCSWNFLFFFLCFRHLCQQQIH